MPGRVIVDKLAGKTRSYFTRGRHGDVLWLENPEEYEKRMAELDEAISAGFSFGGHKIRARYNLAQARLGIVRAEVAVVRAAALAEDTKEQKVIIKAARKDAKKMMRDAADVLVMELDNGICRGAL